MISSLTYRWYTTASLRNTIRKRTEFSYVSIPVLSLSLFESHHRNFIHTVVDRPYYLPFRRSQSLGTTTNVAGNATIRTSRVTAAVTTIPTIGRRELSTELIPTSLLSAWPLKKLSKSERYQIAKEYIWSGIPDENGHVKEPWDIDIGRFAKKNFPCLKDFIPTPKNLETLGNRIRVGLAEDGKYLPLGVKPMMNETDCRQYRVAATDTARFRKLSEEQRHQAAAFCWPGKPDDGGHVNEPRGEDIARFAIENFPCFKDISQTLMNLTNVGNDLRIALIPGKYVPDGVRPMNEKKRQHYRLAMARKKLSPEQLQHLVQFCFPGQPNDSGHVDEPTDEEIGKFVLTNYPHFHHLEQTSGHLRWIGANIRVALITRKNVPVGITPLTSEERMNRSALKRNLEISALYQDHVAEHTRLLISLIMLNAAFSPRYGSKAPNRLNNILRRFFDGHWQIEMNLTPEDRRAAFEKVEDLVKAYVGPSTHPSFHARWEEAVKAVKEIRARGDPDEMKRAKIPPSFQSLGINYPEKPDPASDVHRPSSKMNSD